MTRYVVTKTHTAYGYVTVYKFDNEADANALMARLDNDPRYTYTYSVER